MGQLKPRRPMPFSLGSQVPRLLRPTITITSGKRSRRPPSWPCAIVTSGTGSTIETFAPKGVHLFPDPANPRRHERQGPAPAITRSSRFWRGAERGSEALPYLEICSRESTNNPTSRQMEPATQRIPNCPATINGERRATRTTAMTVSFSMSCRRAATIFNIHRPTRTRRGDFSTLRHIHASR